MGNLVLADRVAETTTTTGTGTVTLAGAKTGYQSFAAIADGNQCYYTIAGGSQWEAGIGTYTASGTTLSRDTVLASSNSGSLVSFSAGSKDVFVSYPASRLPWVQTVVAAGSPSTLTVSGIPAGYNVLRLLLFGQDTNTTVADVNVSLAFNGDTTSGNYSTSQQIGGSSGASIASQAASSSAGGALGVLPESSGTANLAGCISAEIVGYSSTAFYKGVLAKSGARWATGVSVDIHLRFFEWLSTAAITSITATAGGTAFVNGSTLIVAANMW